MNDVLTNAARDVLSERRRQIEKEGWTAAHDDTHESGILGRAGAVYAYSAAMDGRRSIEREPLVLAFIEQAWPFGRRGFKPTDPRRDLVKAAALILAEIERMDRAASLEKPYR